MRVAPGVERLVGRQALEIVRGALSGVPEVTGDAGVDKPQWEGWELDTERIVAALKGSLSDRLRVAAFARCIAKRLYPQAAWNAGAGRLARYLAHRAGYPPDVVEPAAALARYAGLPGMDQPPTKLLYEASLEVDTRELAELADVMTPKIGVERFEATCRTLGCWGKPVEPPPMPEGASLRARRVALAARCEGFCETAADAEAFARSFPPDGKGCLFATVGIPASGKTTFLDRHCGQCLVISMDRMRGVLLGDVSDQSQNELIHGRSMTAIARALEGGDSVIFDATSTTRDGREPFLSIARRTGARVVLIYFDVTLEEALERNARRGRAVPPEIIEHGYRHLEPPRPDEADDIVVVSPRWDRPRHWRFARERWLWEARPVDDIRSVMS